MGNGKIMAKILKILSWILIAAWFVVIMGFVSGEADKVICNRIEVIVSTFGYGMLFLNFDLASLVDFAADASLGGFLGFEASAR